MERDSGGQSHDAQVDSLVAFLADKGDEIGRQLARRYREEIVEYRSLPEGFIEQDVVPTARLNFEQMLLGDFGTEDGGPDGLDVFRESAIRRFRQGVSIQALLHAYRLWGHTVWEQVQGSPHVRDHPHAGLELAGRIMRHVDRVSSAVASAYLDEAAGLIHDQEKGHRDLLEALISGNQPARMASYAARLKLSLDAAYFVVLIRRRSGAGDGPIAMRTCLETVRRSFRDGGVGPAIIGTRDEEVVVLIAAEQTAPLRIRPQLDELARALPNFVVATSRTRQGLGEIPHSYIDAQNAVAFSKVSQTPRAYLFSDTLVDQIAWGSDFRTDLLDETTRPLAAHDARRHTELLPTIKAYVESGYKLAQAAALLNVQPNTVKYRLQRVAELTGHDPFQVPSMTLFSLALRLPLEEPRTSP
ncbi:PucR family transcriptional regulator [Specibacter sp. RAF43]|uniref:PucR family transcriptional regulator n=1 Tax=Specibacter sp. RAF43 TaxID=3233057 RepID=UPI003F9C917B